MAFMSHSLDFLTVEQAAEHLRISTSSLRVKLRSGEIPACKLGRSWMVNRRHVIWRDDLGLLPTAGRPLSPARAWAEIIHGIADPRQPGRYRNRARVQRFAATNLRVLEAGTALGGIAGGQHAGRFWLERMEEAGVDVSIPDIDQHQDVYLPESAQPRLSDHHLRECGDGEAAVRLVPDQLWETLLEASSAPTGESRGMRIAPPLAASLDMFAHPQARSVDAASGLADWYRHSNEAH